MAKQINQDSNIEPILMPPLIDERTPILIEGEVNPDVERKAMRFITDRMKLLEMKALARTVRGIDEIFDSVRENVGRGLARRGVSLGKPGRVGVSDKRISMMDDLIEVEGPELDPDPAASDLHRHRDLTRYLAGIARTERGRALINEAIDRLVNNDSIDIKEALRRGDNYVHEIVIGSGPHAQVYAAERLFLDPDHPVLCIEESSTIGGQFRYETPVHELNTKQGMESANPHENVAGRSGNKNSLGRGILQEPDISYAAYGTQDRLATVVRINQALEAHTVTNAEVSCVRINPYKDKPGRYLVIIIDPQTGEEFEIATDRVVIAAGLGKEVVGFGDDESRAVIAQEQARYATEGEAGILSLGQFHRQTITRIRRGEMPYGNMRHIAVIGAGDSGATVIEQTLGYAGNPGLTTRQDTTIKVEWIGQSLKSESEYALYSRHRYGQISADMPPTDMPRGEYFHRINPIDGRAIAVRRSGNKFILTYALYERDGEGNSILDRDGNKKMLGTKEVEVDHIVLTTGFEREFVDGVCARTSAEMIYEPGAIRNRLQTSFGVEGSIIHLSETSQYESITVIKVVDSDDGRSAHLRVTKRDGSAPEFGAITLSEDGQQIKDFIAQLEPHGIEALEMPGEILNREYIYDPTGEEVASRYRGSEIYKIGPLGLADDPTLDVPKWMEEAPGAVSRSMRGPGQRIGGRVALWTTVPATRDFAKIVTDIDTAPTAEETVFNERVRSERIQLPEPDFVKEEDTFTFVFNKESIHGSIPIGATKEDILKYLASELGERYSFPETLKRISFVVRKLNNGGKETKYEISTEQGFLNDPQYKSLIDDFVLDPLAVAVIFNFVERARNNSARIVIPLRDGRPHIKNVRIEEI